MKNWILGITAMMLAAAASAQTTAPVAKDKAAPATATAPVATEKAKATAPVAAEKAKAGVASAGSTPAKAGTTATKGGGVDPGAEVALKVPRGPSPITPGETKGAGMVAPRVPGGR